MPQETPQSQKTNDEKTLPSEPYKQKIRELQYDFLKYFLGTFILGVAGALSAYIFKSYELKIQARQTESAYLKPYSKCDEFSGDVS